MGLLFWFCYGSLHLVSVHYSTFPASEAEQLWFIQRVSTLLSCYYENVSYEVSFETLLNKKIAVIR